MIRPAAVGGPRSRIEELEATAHPRTTRALTLAIPLVVPAGMRALFPILTRRLGARRGYLAAFGVYWGGRYLVPVALLGRRRIWALLGKTPESLPPPRWLGALALLVPPLGAVGTELLPALRGADPALVATAGAVAAINATGEELLWRGLFVATFPDDLIRGWLWPAIGFTVWHLAPVSVRPPRAGQAVPGPLCPHRRRIRVGRLAHPLAPADPSGPPRHRCQRAASGPVLARPPIDVQLGALPEVLSVTSQRKVASPAEQTAPVRTGDEAAGRGARPQSKHSRRSAPAPAQGRGPAPERSLSDGWASRGASGHSAAAATSRSANR